MRTAYRKGQRTARVVTSSADHFGIGDITGYGEAYIQTLQAKRERGETLSDEEQRILDLFDHATASGVSVVKQSAAKSVGTFIVDNAALILIALVIIVFFAVKKK